ncbi:hypothetical protein ATANTOWER_021604 [Ataeniobius toweri]|uniref:Uncharacterized protein n=1 Tax=Ataeniobius toweri TaxID=208326 RepID=A0ABU7BKA0_9TELE|nr:hypothetical protein [Ataeniobius toweri]
MRSAQFRGFWYSSAFKSSFPFIPVNRLHSGVFASLFFCGAVLVPTVYPRGTSSPSVSTFRWVFVTLATANRKTDAERRLS